MLLELIEKEKYIGGCWGGVLGVQGEKWLNVVKGYKLPFIR